MDTHRHTHARECTDAQMHRHAGTVYPPKKFAVYIYTFTANK